MRKLCFKLVTNLPANSVKPKNVSIVTHTGFNLLLKSYQTEVIDVTNDPMSDNELLGWYKSRYSGYGIGISILKDEPKAAPVEPVAEISVEVPSVEERVEEVVSQVEEKSTVEELPVEEPVVAEEPVPEEKVARVEHKVTFEEQVLQMSYEELLAFATEHDLVIKPGRGRSEECVRKVCLEWAKAND